MKGKTTIEGWNKSNLNQAYKTKDTKLIYLQKPELAYDLS